MLATREPRRPLQASLRRSVSTSYYALFHLLIDEATRRMVPGAQRTKLRECLARAFNHAHMNALCKAISINSPPKPLLPALDGQSLPHELKLVAAAFVELQQARHEADYNVGRTFTRNEVLDFLQQAEQAFRDWAAMRKQIAADVFLVGLLAYRNMHG